jgi:hypothetical protein
LFILPLQYVKPVVTNHTIFIAMSRENNIKIAVFIGMQSTNLGWFDAEEVLVNVVKDNTFDEMDLKFDKSWDWLTAVVGIISETYNRDNEDFNHLCYEIGDAVVDNDLARGYDALVCFINNTGSRTPLIDRVLDEMRNDFDNGDVTAIEEVLKQVPKEVLLGYLPEKL